VATDTEPALQPKRGRFGESDRTFKWIALVAGLCLIGFLAFVVTRPGPTRAPTLGIARLDAPPPAVLRAGTAAPGFSLARLGGGAPVSLAAYRGTPVIVNFFASWCPHCRAELAAIGSVAAQSTGRVAVIGVDSNDGKGAAAQKLLAAAHATYPVGLDTTAQVATKYLLTALPVTYFINAQGQIVGSALGAQSEASLEADVTRLSATSS